MGDFISNILIGIAMGFSSGMFGIGGSIVATPLLALFTGLPALLAVATPLPAAIPSAVSGSVKYHGAGLIEYRICIPALVAAIPFGLLGTYSTDFLEGEILLIAKAIFLMILGLRFFLTDILFQRKDEPFRMSTAGGLLSGALAGFVAGLIAVGGGIVLVTAFVRINNMQMKNAVASSLFCVGILAFVNSLGHFHLGHIDIATTLTLAITVVPFSYLGAKLAVSLKNATLERAFGIFIVIFAIYFIIDLLI